MRRDAPPPDHEGRADERLAGEADQGQTTARPHPQWPDHDPRRCFTCSGVQHRDAVADAWWSWGEPYRQAS